MLESIKDETLTLEKCNIVLIHTANLKLKKYIEKNAWKQLLDVFPYIEILNYEGSHEDIFEKDKNREIRFKLGTLSAEVYRYENTKIKNEYRVNVYLGYFPKYSVITLMYKIDLGDIDVDKLIYVRQALMNSGSGVFDVTADGINKENKLKKHRYVIDISEKIIDDFIKKLNRWNKQELNPETDQEKDYFVSSSVECDHIKDNEIEDVSSIAFVEKNKYEIYGILCTDGGYRYASKSAVDKLVKNRWSSRNYFTVFASDLGTFSIYNKTGELYEAYLKKNNEISEILRGDCYVSSFDFSRINELDGLALFPCEKASIMKSLILKNIFRDLLRDGNWGENQRKIMNERKNILEILNQITHGNMNEITNLYNVILSSFDIMQYVDKVRDRLNLAQEDASLNAQNINNTLVLILTLVGLILTIMSFDFVRSFLSAFI